MSPSAVAAGVIGVRDKGAHSPRRGSPIGDVQLGRPSWKRCLEMGNRSQGGIGPQWIAESERMSPGRSRAQPAHLLSPHSPCPAADSEQSRVGPCISLLPVHSLHGFLPGQLRNGPASLSVTGKSPAGGQGSVGPDPALVPASLPFLLIDVSMGFP